MNEMNFFFRELCGESLSTFNKLYRKVLHCESEGSSKDTHRENPEAVVQRCSVRKDVLRNFTKFTGKHLCQSPFFNKVAGLMLCFFRKFYFSLRTSYKGLI